MTLVVEVAEDRLDAVRELLTVTEGVRAITERSADEADDWEDDDDDIQLEPMTQEEQIAGLKESIQQVNDARAGKIQLGTLQELINELNAMPR